MVKLSLKFTEYLNKVLGTSNNEFSEEELSRITELSMGKDDIGSLRYFTNVTKLEFNCFPSISQKDLDEVATELPKLKELVIENQSALLTLNLEMFFYLEKLSIISNDNMSVIFNIDKLNKLEELVIYDNKKLDISNLYEYISELKIKFKLDLVYYYKLADYLIKNDIDISDKYFDYVSFVDCYGYRNVHTKTLKKEALTDLINNINNIVSLYCYKGDSELKKFNVLHDWMLKNITYINEDIEEHLDYYGVVDAFVFNRAGRLSYARVFQLLLLAAGMDATLVYSSGVNSRIGEFGGHELLKFYGEGDYALVRCMIDGRYSYTDIAWNKYAVENNCYNDLKILLVSKDELLMKHRVVGEGIVEKSSTINAKVIEEILDDVKNTIHDVDYMFGEVNVDNNSVNVSSQMFATNNKEIDDLKQRINQEEVGTELYNSLVEELIDLEKVINSYNKILVKYNDGQREIINKYSNFILNNYFGVISESKLDNSWYRKLELMNKYNVISKYLYDLLNMYLNVNNVK